MKVIVFTNPQAGAKADEKTELLDALAAAGVEAEVRQIEGEDLTREARDALSENVEAIIAAGGDGTISAVAEALVDSTVPLGILPTGSLNHFAKDLGLPPTVQQAAQVIAARNVRAIDVAEVNGRIFINNCSIGIYPHIVKSRDRQRQRLGRGKWLAMLLAALSVFRRHPLLRVRIAAGEEKLTRTTPFVFVGNNAYEMSLTTLGTRARLDGGILCVYFANRESRFALVLLALRAILGRLEQAKDFETITTTQVQIETSKKTLRVAMDGEVLQLRPPLNFRVRPAALRVLARAPAAPANNAARTVR